MTASPPTAADIDQGGTMEPASSTSLHPVNTLFVWDFDWTIVNCNSDEYVPAKFLGTATTEKRLRELYRPGKWHECVSTLVNACMTEQECSKQDICDAAASMPYLVDVRGSLEDVAADSRCGQMIISDGNDEFIGAFLKKNGLEQCFSHGLETNFGKWDMTEDTEKFSVVHQSTKYGGHTSKSCPPNLCKSQVLRDTLSRMESSSKRPRIVYVGDGSNDACPGLNVLIEGDVLLARDGRKINDPNSKTGPQPDEDISKDDSTEAFPILSVVKKAELKDGQVPKCQVCAWNSGRDLRSLVKNLLNEK